MPLLHLIQGDGSDLFIPAHSISWVEGFPAGTNTNAPEAISLARYNIGQGDQTIVFRDEAADIVERVMQDDKGRKDWLEFDKGAGFSSLIPASFITGITGLKETDPREDGGAPFQSRIHFNLGPNAMTADVVERAVDVNELLNSTLAGAKPKMRASKVTKFEKAKSRQTKPAA